MIVKDNTPSVGYISWSDVQISYKGVVHQIADGNTDYIYVYWRYSDPTSFYGSDYFPTLGDDDLLVFLNKNGVHVTVPNATVVDGSLIVPESILANAISANAINTDHLASNSVTADQVAANAIGASAIAADAVLAEHIKAGQIDTSHISSEGLDVSSVTGAATEDQVSAIETSLTAMNGKIEAKASQTDLDTTNGTLSDAITQIELVADGLTSKASTDDLNNLEGRVSSAESTITQHADAIDAKVEKTDYDVLEGRVDTAESQISANATAIQSRVTTTVFNELMNRVGKAESSITQHATSISSKVEVDDYNGNKITSLINQTASSVTISANKINFDGHVFGTSATFKGNIEGGRITSDTRIDVTTELSVGDRIYLGGRSDNTMKSIYFHSSNTISSEKTPNGLYNMRIYTQDGLEIDSFAGSVTIPNRPLSLGSGTGNRTLLQFNIEHPWRFTSTGSGSGSALVLQSESGSKSFYIQTNTGENIAEFRVTSGAPYLESGTIRAKYLRAIGSNRDILTDRDNGNVTLSADTGRLIIGYQNTSYTEVNSDLAVGTIRSRASSSPVFTAYTSGVTEVNASNGVLRLGYTGTTAVDIHTPQLRARGTGDFYFRPYPGTDVRLADTNGSWRYLRAAGLIESSSAKFKKNIEDFNENALEKINGTKIKKFHYKSELDEELKHVGVIMEESPPEIVDVRGEGVMPVPMVALSWKAIQELTAELDSLKNELQLLKGGTSQ